MIFHEFRFFVFLAVVLAAYWSLRGHGARKCLLLAGSCVFYGAWSAEFLALMLGTALLDYGAGRLLARWDDVPRRRAVLAASVIVNLGALGFFKYWNFFTAAAADLLTVAGLRADPLLLDIVLPVGISFYTFQSLSYTIDVYRRAIPPSSDVRDFLLFVTFFPQLVAGPIVRAADFLPQLGSIRAADRVRFRACAALFLVGFAKKACVADRVAGTVDVVFASPGDHAGPALWAAALLYAAQIYCDFSGYSDMAIATAGAFGYRLTRNFDAPYVARSVTDFWRRWHISLSTWFRDYLYVPLGGNRAGATATGRNLLIVFVLCGLWHGAAWTFLVWGLWHGAALLAERAGLRRILDALPAEAGLLWTLAVVVLGWVWFRSETAGSAAAHLAGMFGGGESGAQREVSSWWWAVLAALAVAHRVGSRRNLVPAAVYRVPLTAFALIYGAAWALVLAAASIGNRPFIYFQF